MSDHDRKPAMPESEALEAAGPEIDDSTPEELDAVVDALPGSGKLDTPRDELGDAAGGPMQVP